MIECTILHRTLNEDCMIMVYKSIWPEWTGIAHYMHKRIYIYIYIY